MTQKEFADSMGYLGLAYSKEFTQQEIMLYYDFLKEYTDETLTNAIKSIIKTSKFLPKINELIDECEKHKKQSHFEIIEFMIRDGYFKHDSEIEKAQNYLRTGIIPQWFKDVLNDYYKRMKQDVLEHQETLLIGG